MTDIYGYIYKITNNVNGKVYIGQTNRTIEKRFKQHISLGRDNDEILYRAFRKYGIENFSVEQVDIANDRVEINEKESYWIEKSRSFIGFDDCEGYNMTLGGEGRKGGSLLTQEQVIEIKEMLRDTNLSCVDIGKKFNVSGRNISAIHEGFIYNYIVVEGHIYGSKRDVSLKGDRNPNTELTSKDVIKIKEMLRDTDLNYKDIAQSINTNTHIVGRIYRGERWGWLEVNGFEPRMIRNNKFKKTKKMKRITDNEAKKIKEMLVEGNLFHREIADFFGISRTVVTNISSGKNYSHIYVDGFKINTSGRVKSSIEEEKVREIKEKSMTNKYYSRELCEEYDISLCTLWDILNGVNYNNVILEGYSRDKVSFKNNKGRKKTKK